MRCFSYSSIPSRGLIPLLLLLCLLFVTTSASISIDYRVSKCNNASNYTEGSTYSNNLNRVLNYLIQNGSRSGFNATSYGQSPNVVYGLIQCVGNISAQDCSNCSEQARSRLQTYCSDDIGGQVWMTYCYLRYDNSSFVSKLDTGAQYLTNVDTVSNGVDSFKSVKFDLLSNLSKIASNASSKGFAIGTANYSASNTIYGLSLCRRDTSASDCNACLKAAIQGVESCCSANQGAQAMLGSCTVRFEIYPFYEPAESSSPSPFTSPDRKYIASVAKVSDDVESFKSVKFNLLSNLSKSAASKGSAIETATYSASKSVIGMASCPRNVSPGDCNACLKSAIQGLQACCSTNQNAEATLPNCTVNYVSSSSPSSASLPGAEGSQPPNSSTPADTPANGTLPLSKSNKKSSKTLPIILGTLGGVILVIVIWLFALRRKLKSSIFGEPVTALTHHKERHGYSAETGLLSEENIYLFSLATLIEASQNFHPDYKLGEGGFGAVYKGTTKDGKDISVKKLSATSSQGKNEFLNEVKIVANIQHRNLVKLLGCCVEGYERLLVYEYLPNKSLDNFLFDPEKRKHLDWEKRYNIIVGIARGLLYLHEDSQLRIIHRDVKASNILLDDKLNPKIADFGLARLFPQDETHIQTRVAGTYGYMAPEYAMQGQLSVKADVYSFGVLLLEIVSGRKNNDKYLSQDMQNLLEWVWRLYKRGDVLNMVDSMVIQNCPQKQAQRCIHIGLLCVQANAGRRPVISNVLKMISSNLVTLPNPTKPAFVSSGQGLSPESSSRTATTSLGFSSVNDISLSELIPR